MRCSAFLCLLMGAASVAGAQSAAPGSAAWSYTGRSGPLNWGKLDPAYRACSEGHEQSPIDIRGAHLNKALKPIEFHYLAGPVTVENTGNLIVVHVDPGSYMVADGVRYELKRLEIHRPSEHAIKGKLTDMDVEMVHAGADGKMAAVAVRLTQNLDEPNATLAMLWTHLPTAPHTSQKIDTLVNPAGFLPADPGYWTYMGSLTTPPCTEGVRWFVMQQDVAVSRDQVRDLQRLFRIGSRPLQDPHGRRIEANE
jgi:carbonic anhydrase